MPRRFTAAIFCRATFLYRISVRRIRCSPAATKSGKRQDRPRLHAETTPPGDPRDTGRPPTIRFPLRKDSFPATGGKDRRQTRNASDGFLRHLRQNVRREPSAAHRAKIHRRSERTAGRNLSRTFCRRRIGGEPFRSLRKRSSARRNGRRCRFSNRLRSFRPRKIPT